MKGNTNRIARTAMAVLLTIAAGSCSDLNKQAAPVTLLVTTAQSLHHIDLALGATNCDQSLGTVSMKAIAIQSPPSVNFPPPNPADLNVVKIDRYQVSWVRLDGGHLVPAPAVRSTSISLTVGQSGELSTLVVFDANTLNQAPFAALQPQNGGVDPETGRQIITMDAVIQVFGETLAGERVSGTTRMTLDFCYSCSGCS